ncbi:MAG TPA: holo-ACP synthase [Patescibacteria group bacterium]|nr:holo-ACP synthase [Patescibacteria group bacterium]
MKGVGVDIIEIERVNGVLERRGDRFIEHVFLPGEVAYCQSRREPARHFAARFSAKEAVVKALGVKRGMTFLWRDIEILRSVDGVPTARLSGRALDLARRRGVTELHISLSHSDTHAVAMATAV